MAVENIKAAIEAVLFSNGQSVERSRIARALEIEEKQVETAVNELIADYKEQKRGITIIKLDDAYQMTASKEYAPQIRTVMDLRRNTPLSQAALEVLAVVAYNQPVTKAFVEQVRGVDCSGVIGSLTAKGLVEEKGRLELPGRPLLYGTTENFLRCFNIESIDRLPPLPENDAEEKSDETQSEQDKEQAQDEDSEPAENLTKDADG